MSTHSAENGTDAAVLRDVLAATAGRPALAPVHAAASALSAEIDTAGESDVPPSALPPGGVPDVDVPGVDVPDVEVPGVDVPGVDVPHTTRPRIDQPLGDPLTGTTSGVFADSATSSGFTNDGTPTWDGVREKVDGRVTSALGREELDRSTPAGRTADEQWNAREAAGRSKLDEIRRSMKDDNPGS